MAVANEDTNVSLSARAHNIILLRTQNLFPRHKKANNVSELCQKHFVSTTNVYPFARPRKHHEQQCVCNNVKLSHWKDNDLASVVQRMDNVIHRINHYPVDSVVCFATTYPLDSDLSGG